MVTKSPESQSAQRGKNHQREQRLCKCEWNRESPKKYLFWCQDELKINSICFLDPVKPDIWKKELFLLNSLLNLKKLKSICVSYLMHQAFMAHIVWFSENMELILGKKKKTLTNTEKCYSVAQTKQTYATWCRCRYLYGKKKRNSYSFNVNQSKKQK